MIPMSTAHRPPVGFILSPNGAILVTVHVLFLIVISIKIILLSVMLKYIFDVVLYIYKSSHEESLSLHFRKLFSVNLTVQNSTIFTLLPN